MKNPTLPTYLTLTSLHEQGAIANSELPTQIKKMFALDTKSALDIANIRDFMTLFIISSNKHRDPLATVFFNVIDRYLWKFNQDTCEQNIANLTKILTPKNNIENMGIFELRNYARAVGVHSPTAKTAEILRHEIKQIENGGLTPCLSTRKGRPPKLFLNISPDNDLHERLNCLIDTVKDACAMALKG